MKLILLILVILSSTLSYAQQENCFNFRDESGLKVCNNDTVLAMGTNDAKLLNGPYKVLSVDEDGVADLQYIRTDGKLGFTRKAVVETELFIMENRPNNFKTNIGDKILRKSDSKIFEVIGLGLDNSVAVKLGSQLKQWLEPESYIKL